MAEVTNELIYEILKQLKSDMAGVKEALRETNASLNAIRIHLLASGHSEHVRDFVPA